MLLVMCDLLHLCHVFHPIQNKEMLNCNFEQMPKYGVTPLLSPFDIDFDRPLFAAACLLVTRTLAMLLGNNASSPYLGICIFGQLQIRNESAQVEYSSSTKVTQFLIL